MQSFIEPYKINVLTKRSVIIFSLVAILLLSIGFLVTYVQPGISKQNTIIAPFYFLVIIALALVAPMVIDQVLSYYRGIVQGKDEAPTPMSGLYRGLMTFGVILLVGSVVFYILGILSSSVIQPLPTTINSLANLTRTISESNLSSDSAQQIIQLATRNSEALIGFNNNMIEIIKNIAIVLGGAVSAIIGFYFGNKAATDHGERVGIMAEGRLLKGGNNGEDKGRGGPSDKKQVEISEALTDEKDTSVEEGSDKKQVESSEALMDEKDNSKRNLK